ncbi:efflux RND transporter periplasmic adaptor subunit [Pedobacter zeae]|uniref:Cobalt-zinc-cadmium efflux system membrane fusion protein n=1 Tax=Pedobacter zeae TaxID=1737356 RepID=A0A7W6KAU8_9SPHI|nr:efflux RND transporter periplasmic adaptor subunit [Pedobacter zeae]MBB4108390.1 cobalt-zinc-cadmium efflux system membrane fusion protein [Pedobacter zeae]GGG93113.1 hemolysin D [Pedobacter zeae]
MQNLYKSTLLIATSSLLLACSEHPTAAPHDKFVLTDSLINRLLIDTVHQANNKTELLFSAKIAADEEHRSELFPMVSGTVNSVKVRLGDQVSSGQILATLSSSEMAGFNKDVIAANAELKNAERSVKQAEQLFQSGLSSAKELEEAKNDYQVKKAEAKRANAVLKLNGGSSTGLYAIKSPINGFVIEKNVTQNMHLRGDNDKSLFTIADLSNVWAMINIYESDISRVKAGDEVSLSTLSYPDKIFSGKIEKLYNQVDQDSKVILARVVIRNPGFLLKPGMLGTVKVSANSAINLPVLHSGSVIFDENKNYVLVLAPDHKVKIQEIEIGHKTADKTYISKGVSAGDRIIASKQVFLFESLKTR